VSAAGTGLRDDRATVATVYAALAPLGGCGDVDEVKLDDPIEPENDQADSGL
jgi:hypothetical protein